MFGLNWTPEIGDPSFAGWLTVVAYFYTCWCCVQAFKAEKSGPPRPFWQLIAPLFRVLVKHWPQVPGPAQRSAIWLLLAGLLLALGINKQLDLQSLLTELGRKAAHAQGWYEDRREVQSLFILVVLLGAIASMWFLHIIMRGLDAAFRLAGLGASTLCAFVVIRAASFHGVDELIDLSFLGLRVNWILELGGISMITIAARRRLSQRREAPR